MKKARSIVSFLVLLFLTSSCVETIIASSVTASYLASREKSVLDMASDVKIASVMGSNFVANGLKNPNNSVDITVNEGRVLLTGIVRDPKKARKAIDLAWQVKNVREVIDEIQIAKDARLRLKDISNSAIDYGLTVKVETKLLFAKNVKAKNYKITTVGKTVYLLGTAQNQDEINRALQAISMVIGVERVVNHVILKDDRRRRRS